MKLTPLFAILCFIILVTACSKDKFQTKPRLEIKDYTTKEVVKNDVLRIRINYFDKEGDLSEGLLYARRVRLNVKSLTVADNDKSDSLDTHLPVFPAEEKAEINFQQTYDFLKESISENDTIVFRFAVTDKAGNTSDTITTSRLVIHLP